VFFFFKSDKKVDIGDAMAKYAKSVEREYKHH